MHRGYEKSIASLQRAKRSLAGGVSSNVRAGDKPHPLFFERGMGARLWDVDGNEYIDYVLGRGPLFLGHSHPAVIEATCRQLQLGQIYAAQHLLEIELAESICRIVPCAELVRFGISGSEAVHGALRLARAATGRRTVIKFEGQYHGWLDNILYSLSPDPARAGDWQHPLTLAETPGQFQGEESHVVVLPWNHLPTLEQYLEHHRGEIAAIITEPAMCNTAVIPPLPGYLEGMRELCTQHGIVLIFDEVITGFRLSLAGAQGRFGVEPDLTIFGKAIANGMPISCIAGRERYMGLIAAGKVGHGGTYNSIPPAVAGAIATIQALEADGCAVYRRVEDTGRMVMEGLRALGCKLDLPLVVQGYGAIFYLGFPKPGEPLREGQAIVDYRSSLAMDQDLYNAFVSDLVGRGVRVIPRGNWFLSAAHSEADVAATLAAVEAALVAKVVPAYTKAVQA